MNRRAVVAEWRRATESMGAALLEWHASVEPADKPFVKRILKAFQ